MSKLPMAKDVINHISVKRKELAQASENLKKHFVGMDDIIDRVVKDIETWYIMPNLLTRPTIICLWGLTGVGKTDFVRRLIRELSMYDRYCEIEMSNKGLALYPWANSISAILNEYSHIDSGDQGVILLDEIQNYRTIDEHGQELRDIKMKDVWLLLSDGKLPAKMDLDHLMSMIWEHEKKNGRKKRDVDEDKINTPLLYDDDDDVLGGKSYGALMRFKRLLRLTNPIEEIQTWTIAKRKEMIKRKISDQSVYDEEDYTKCLIFVSGNLDEAYPFAKASEEADIDADLFHEMSLRINLIDVKSALQLRFKPEQIARLGNNHVIYPSLSEQTYLTIIERKKQAVINSLFEQYGLQLSIDTSIDKLVYDNGVFPAQGTRPVFSTISEIIESPLPKLVLECLIDKSKEISMHYDAETSEIVGDFKRDRDVRIKYVGALDKLKKKRENAFDLKTKTAVHEAGHAVVYVTLFGWCPPQIVSTTSSSTTAGFMYAHAHCGAKKLNEREIAVLLAGSEAEKIVFGSDAFTTGCTSDLYKATSIAAKMVRNAGMDDYHSMVTHPGSVADDDVNNDIDGTNCLVERIIKRQKVVANDNLLENKELFIETSQYLIDHQEIPQEEFKKICEKYGITIEIKSSEEEYALEYRAKFNSFVNGKT